MQNSNNNGERSLRLPYIVKTYHFGFKPIGNKFWSKNNLQPPPESWDSVPITIVEEKDLPGTRIYQKDWCYPEGRHEFCPEEIRAYKWFAKKGIENKFTSSRDVVWKEKLNQMSCSSEVQDVEMSESSLGLSLLEHADTSESQPATSNESSIASHQAHLQKTRGLNKLVPLQKKTQNRPTVESSKLSPLPHLTEKNAFAKKRSPTVKEMAKITEKLPKIVINNKNNKKPVTLTSKVQSVIELSTTQDQSTIVSEQDNDEPIISVESKLSSNDEESDKIEKSIYSEEDKKLEEKEESWEEVRGCKDPEAQYTSSENNLNESLVVIEEHKKQKVFNPFSKLLQDALLNKLQFVEHLRSIPNCNLKKIVRPLAKGHTLESGSETFDIIKVVGKGAYGTVFSAAGRTTNKNYALKQERPANIWEYYICLEVKNRLEEPNMLAAFMSIDQAIIGNNASILISEFCPYGTLIDACNAVKKSSNLNMDELIVMLVTCQILNIVHHLHKCKIIHADIKPDNFLVTSMIDIDNPSEPFIRLTDFGIAIDMKILEEEKPGIEFELALTDDKDPCIEMRNKKPWTYQLDLYGMIGTSYAILFGKYMDVEKINDSWKIKSKFPRYYKQELWDFFFNTLLNIPNSKELPNLLEIKGKFEEYLDENKKSLKQKTSNFNTILLSK